MKTNSAYTKALVAGLLVSGAVVAGAASAGEITVASSGPNLLNIADQPPPVIYCNKAGACTFYSQSTASLAGPQLMGRDGDLNMDV